MPSSQVPATRTAPLAGVRILDFTQNLPGPYATLVLASLGAEVVKVEPPRGETGRGVPRFFELVNAGKKSIVVDLKDEAARASLTKVLPAFDVVVEGFRPGVLDALGFGYEAVRAVNPRVVYCSISAYGREGPYRDRPAHDLNLQALAGACDIGRDADDVPHGSALPIADLSSSLTAATAISSALFARERDGEGRYLDVALADTIVSWSYIWGEGLVPSELPLEDALPKVARAIEKTGFAREAPLRDARMKAAIGNVVSALRSDVASDVAARVGKGIRGSRLFGKLERLRLHNLPHYDLFPTLDGRHLAVGIVDEDKFWSALAKALGLGDLAKIPLAGRFALGRLLRPRVAAALLRKTRDQWLAELDLDEVPVSPVLTVDEAMRDPHLAARRPEGATPAIPPPLARVTGRGAPRLGEHTADVLGGR